MNQTVLIVGFILLLAIQIGFINVKPLTNLFQGSGYESDGDDDYDDTRRHRKRKSRHMYRQKMSRTTGVELEKHIPGTEIHSHPHSTQKSRKQNSVEEELMTSLDALPSDISRKIPIRGSELTQDQSIPWKQTHNTPRSYSGGDDPEEIQMKIMEELESNSMNHSQLMPSPF
jgi:hypothetical protein